MLYFYIAKIGIVCDYAGAENSPFQLQAAIQEVPVDNQSQEEAAVDNKQSRAGRWVVLLLKSTKLVKLFKVLKVLKLGKPLVTIVSMSLSALVYSVFLGPWFAVGFVLLLFVHEMGHVVALQQKGFKASAPVFIPMLGAVIFAPKFNDAETEAYVGYGGPLFGAVISWLTAALWWFWPGRPVLLLMLAYVSAFINLFNLIPIRPLDGGRITQAVGRWYKYIGVFVLLLFTLYIREPGFLLIWILILGDINLKPKVRAAYAGTCWTSMVLLMLMGYGDQHWGVDLLDVGLGALIGSTYFAQAAGKIEETVEELKELPVRQRLKWLGYYSILFLVLLGLMVVLIPHLPDMSQR